MVLERIGTWRASTIKRGSSRAADLVAGVVPLDDASVAQVAAANGRQVNAVATTDPTAASKGVAQ
jgi:hypothetical protein